MFWGGTRCPDKGVHRPEGLHKESCKWWEVLFRSCTIVRAYREALFSASLCKAGRANGRTQPCTGVHKQAVADILSGVGISKRHCSLSESKRRVTLLCSRRWLCQPSMTCCVCVGTLVKSC